MCWFWASSHRLRRIESLLESVLHQGGRIMATLDDIIASVDSEDAVDDSIIALLTGIKAQLDAVLAGGITPAQQAKVDAIFAKVEASKAKVAAAVVANTPAEPPA
jgi:hypothetical protein